MQKSLIIGASGFCGRHLATRLRAAVAGRIVGTTHGGPGSPPGGLDEVHNLNIIEADDVAQLIRLVRPDWIFHLAGLIRGDEPDIYRTNFLGTTHLLEAVRRHSPHSAILLVGSAAEYGRCDSQPMPIHEACPCRPVGSYAISKYATTLMGLDYAARFGLKVAVVRPFNVVGAGVPPSVVAGAFLERLKTALLQGEHTVHMGNIDTQRDFIAVEDLASAYVSIMLGGHWNEIINLCSGEPVSIRSILERLAAHARQAIRIEVNPNLVRSSDVRVIYGSCEKARRLFGFQPRTSLDVALARAYEAVMQPAPGTVPPR